MTSYKPFVLLLEKLEWISSMPTWKKKSYHWDHIQKLSHTINIRVDLNIGNADNEFATQFLNVKNRLLEKESHNQIQLPIQTIQTEEGLIARVFPDVHIQHFDNKWLYDWARLANKHVSVKEMNIRLQSIVSGEERSYKPVDNISSWNQIINHPAELLNSLESKETAPQNILLKIGAPIMLFCKLDPKKLCNVIRLTIKRMIPHVLELTIMSRDYPGVNCSIPQIPMRPTDLPFEFERLQFPVSFAMTINNLSDNHWKLLYWIWHTLSFFMARFMFVFQDLEIILVCSFCHQRETPRILCTL